MPLPPIDSAQLREAFFTRLHGILNRYVLHEDVKQQSLDELWEHGGELYFLNLRRIKLFLNKIDHSIARIGREVNIVDFVRLELVRDVAPAVYDSIYIHPQYFYDADMAFEVKFQGRTALDSTRAKDERAGFFDRMMAALPVDRKYVEEILIDLFPHFAAYKGRYLARSMPASEAEVKQRIYHPRCFRQYFQFRVPSELFSQDEFDVFLSRIRKGSEDEVIGLFNETFKSLDKEEFKRWHFLHRIELAFDTFEMAVAQGLCRGFAQNSSIWSSDAFEFMISIRSTRKTLLRIDHLADKENFLLLLIQESSSTLCALLLYPNSGSSSITLSLETINGALRQKLRNRYLVQRHRSMRNSR